MVCNIILIIVKFISGLFINNISLLVSGFDALTGLIASFTVIVGLKSPQKDPSEKFPHGYYRLETLATLIVAILILMIGINVIYQSFNVFLNPVKISQPLIGVVVVLFSIIVAYGLYRNNFRIGEKSSSNALISSARESQFDNKGHPDSNNKVPSCFTSLELILKYYIIG